MYRHLITNYKLSDMKNHKVKVAKKKLTEYKMEIFVIRIISNNFVPCNKTQKI